MIVQVLDYGISLTCNDGSLATKQLFKLLQVLIVVKRGKDKGGYIKTICIQLLILMYQKLNKLPHWTIVQDNLAAYNEEQGEMSFLMLPAVYSGIQQETSSNN